MKKLIWSTLFYTLYQADYSLIKTKKCKRQFCWLLRYCLIGISFCYRPGVWEQCFCLKGAKGVFSGLNNAPLTIVMIGAQRVPIRLRSCYQYIQSKKGNLIRFTVLEDIYVSFQWLNILIINNYYKNVTVFIESLLLFGHLVF